MQLLRTLPLEGKLSAVRLTDEVDAHGTQPLRTLPLEGKLSPKVTDEVGTLQAALDLRMVRVPLFVERARGPLR